MFKNTLESIQLEENQPTNVPLKKIEGTNEGRDVNKQRKRENSRRKSLGAEHQIEFIL